jgi:hypothetical protein
MSHGLGPPAPASPPSARVSASEPVLASPPELEDDDAPELDDELELELELEDVPPVEDVAPLPEEDVPEDVPLDSPCCGVPPRFAEHAEATQAKVRAAAPRMRRFIAFFSSSRGRRDSKRSGPRN